MKHFTNFSRLFVGLLFIISGMIKANDPLGFSYKLTEYFEVFGTPWMSPLALALSMFICVFEVVCGIATLAGSRAVWNAWALMVMIVFFTFLTFYSAYFNKVTDCGCFGDAVKLTPWQSFSKDLLLLVFIIPIFLQRKKIHPILAPKKDNALLIVSTVLVTGFTLYCYLHLPVKDFRPYAVGKNIPEQMRIPEGAKLDKYETKLFYEKDGVVKEFTPQNYPWQDSTWVYKDTKSVLIEKGFQPAIHDFSITSVSDGSNYTEEILANPDYNFILVERDVNKASRSVQPKINEFVKQCQRDSVAFIALTASGNSDIENFRHEVQAMYDFYTCDDTQLKTMIRANPGLILLKKGTVIAMWHHNDFPAYGEFKEKYKD